jgi:hypothetical protein
VFRGGLLLLVMALALPAQAALNDPTRPPVAATVHAPAVRADRGPRWVLNSTLVSPARRTAVINDRVVAVGDRVGGAVVVDIQSAAVRLRARGRELTLVMLHNNVKQPSRQPVKGSGTP